MAQVVRFWAKSQILGQNLTTLVAHRILKSKNRIGLQSSRFIMSRAWYYSSSSTRYTQIYEQRSMR